jgi:hypothetical protein
LASVLPPHPPAAAAAADVAKAVHTASQSMIR